MSSNNIYGAFPTTTNGPFHYLYRITNLVENKHYYGIRTSRSKMPHQDLGVKYFSSSNDKEFKKDQKEHPENYKYKVIIVSNSRQHIADLEIKIHKKFNVGVNEKFYNRAIHTSTGFGVTGRTSIKDDCGKFSSLNSNHPKILSGEWGGVTKGTRWIYNYELKKSAYLNQDDILPEGWVFGRKDKNKRRKWITNIELKTNRLINQEDSLPEGWVIGKRNFEEYTRKRWIYNPELKKNAKIEFDAPLPTGWEFGLRNKEGEKLLTPNNKGTRWIYNPELNKNTRIKVNEPIPDGWILDYQRSLPKDPKTTKDYKWIYNPESKENRRIGPNENLPDGWLYGIVDEFGNKVVPPSQKGLKYIYNLELRQNKYLKPDEILPEGWSYGRKRF